LEGVPDTRIGSARDASTLRDQQLLADADNLAAQAVHLPQRGHGDAIALRNAGQGLAAADDVSQRRERHRLRVPRHVGAVRRVRHEVIDDAREDGVRQMALVLGVVQSGLLRGIGDVARLDEDGRNVRRLQHDEAGLLHRTRGGLSAAAPDLQINFNATIPELLPPDCPRERPSFTFITILVRPHSIGNVTLRSSDPADPPVIRENYLQCEADLQVQLKAIELCRELVETRAFAEFFDGEALPGAGKTEAELRDYVRSHASTIWHPVGTCKMGYDRMAVVDPQLRVHGVQGLRVADASIMPAIVSANPNAACIMIGEKAADMM
jgi:choline dehydrogenase-like flavoprotein